MFYRELATKTRCRSVKSALCMDFESGSVLGMAILNLLTAFTPLTPQGQRGLSSPDLSGISPETLSPGLEMHYQNYLSL